MPSSRKPCRRAAILSGILLAILLIADRGSRRSLLGNEAADPGCALVRVVETSLFKPPSPDPTCLLYLPARRTLLLGDAEVDEMTLFEGKNIFEVALTGELVSSASTGDYTLEPTGLALDHARNHLYVSDDNVDGFYQVKPGPDGALLTSDDLVSFYDTAAFGGTDPEDIAFDGSSGQLVILDGRGAKVYRLAPGADGVFNGVPPAGDDEVAFFETSQFGVEDPEGLALDPASGHIFLIGQPPHRLVETTISGTLMGILDISQVEPLKPSALALAPGSVNPEVQSLYVADRRIDNAEDPSENDGRLYELSLPLIPGNRAPRIDAGPDLAVLLPAVAELRGSVTDDGRPDPPGRTNVRWRQATGKGTVTFADAAAPETTAEFSIAGEYILRLSASDGESSGFDECRVIVSGSRRTEIAEARVAAGSDDAVERSGGSVSLRSTDIRMVFDRGVNQVVGLRFQGVEVPRYSTVFNAYIQFEVEAESVVATSLQLQGEAADDAGTFTSAANDVSARPRTIAAVAWDPDPWRIRGERGIDQRTPNLAPILNEIVFRRGWTAASSMALIITGNGQRVAATFEKSPEAAPSLYIEYIPSARRPFRRGDVNGDRVLDISDTVWTLLFLFLGDRGIPPCLEAADLNDDLAIDISDAVHGLEYLFLDGPAPLPPFRECRPDSAEETLGCNEPNCDELP